MAMSARHSQNSQTGNGRHPACVHVQPAVSLAKLLGRKQVGSGLLDDIAISGSSRFEQTMQAPDSVFNSGNWEDVTFSNGEHTARRDAVAGGVCERDALV